MKENLCLTLLFGTLKKIKSAPCALIAKKNMTSKVGIGLATRRVMEITI